MLQPLAQPTEAVIHNTQIDMSPEISASKNNQVNNVFPSASRFLEMLKISGSGQMPSLGNQADNISPRFSTESGGGADVSGSPLDQENAP